MADRKNSSGNKENSDSQESSSKKVPPKKGKKGKVNRGKEQKKPKKTGPNTFLLLIAVLLLAVVMLWVTGAINFSALLGQDSPPQDAQEIANAQPTGSAPVTFAAIQPGQELYTVNPEAAKLAKIYSEMRPQKAADALSQMPVEEAMPIMAAMDEWRAGIIMSKMEAAKAVEISQLMAETYRTGEANAGEANVLP
jgi:cytoskeletal protein RodZ